MTDLPAPEPKTYKPASARKPIRKLDRRGEKLVQLMVFGFDDEDEAARWGLPAFQPLSLDQAAAPAGLRRSNARFIFGQPIFLRAYSEGLGAMRNAHKARAVMTMAQIMSDEGDASAATKAVRVKAAAHLLGDESRAGANVNVTLNQSTVNLTAGVVVRLPSSAAPPPLERQPIEIDGERIEAQPIDDDQIQLDPDAAPAMARAWPHTGGE